MALSDQFSNLGYKLFRDPTGRMVLNESGGLGQRAGFFTISPNAAKEIAASGVPIVDVSRTDSEEILSAAGATGLGTSKGSIESFSNFQSVIGKKIGNLTNALKAQKGDKIAVANEDLLRSEAVRLLGFDPGYDQAAETARYQAGLAVANTSSGGRKGGTGIPVPGATFEPSPSIIQPPVPLSQVPTSLQQQVDSTNSSLVANKDYVNAVFKAYHGRDANAQELQQFTGKTVGSVRDTIKAGAPKAKLTTPTFSGGEVTQPVDASKVSDSQLTDFLTGVSQGKDAAGSFISSLSSANLITQLSEALKSDLQTQAEQGLSSSLGGLQDIGTALDQKKAYSQGLFGAQGYDIQGKVQQLNQLQLQSAQLTADYLTGRSQIGQQPIPMDLIVGQQKALDEQAAIKIGLLNAQAAAMTDNISLSQSLIDQMVNIQFGDLDARLQVTQSMINTYKDIASSEESKTMQKVQTLLDERKQQLAEQKDQKTQVYNLVLDVAKAGGDTSKVKIDGTLEDAILSASQELSRLNAPLPIAVGTKVSGGTASGVSGGVTKPVGSKSYGELSALAKSVVDGTIKLSDLTATDKGKIASELNAYGYKSAADLNAGQQQTIADLDTIIGLATQIKNYSSDGVLEGVGPFSGSVGSFVSGVFGTGTEEAKSVRALVGNIRGTIAKLRGGTSFTVNEERLLNSYTPATTDNSSTLLNKLGLLQEFLQSSKSNLLKVTQPTRGGNVDISDINFK